MTATTGNQPEPTPSPSRKAMMDRENRKAAFELFREHKTPSAVAWRLRVTHKQASEWREEWLNGGAK